MKSTKKIRVLSIFGTRPEAVKMAPLMRQLAADPALESIVCVTGQHKTMLRQVMDLFGIVAHYDLDIMLENQTLNGLSSRLFLAIDEVLSKAEPDRVVVHGDTTTAMVAAVAAFQRRIPVAHVEAGLRTRHIAEPWPEEMNRRVVDIVSDMLFAPTANAKENLQGEHLEGKIFVTGNTVVDALNLSTRRIADDALLRASLDARLPALVPGKKLLLVTGHRRENFGPGILHICNALVALSLRPDIQIVYPVHLNPNIQEPVLAALANVPNIHLIEPLDYFQFVRLMQQAHVILTDSGGVQEEAPSLGKPVLVMRNVTERPEAVLAGTVQLVGTDAASIVSAVEVLYDNDALWREFSVRQNPYGDGRAAQRITAAIAGREVHEFNAGVQEWPMQAVA